MFPQVGFSPRGVGNINTPVDVWMILSRKLTLSGCIWSIFFCEVSVHDYSVPTCAYIVRTPVCVWMGSGCFLLSCLLTRFCRMYATMPCSECSRPAPSMTQNVVFTHHELNVASSAPHACRQMQLQYLPRDIFRLEFHDFRSLCCCPKNEVV